MSEHDRNDRVRDVAVGMIVLVGVFIIPVLMIVIVSVVVFVLFRHCVSSYFLVRTVCLVPVASCLFALGHSFHDFPLLVRHLHNRQTGVSHQIEIL